MTSHDLVRVFKGVGLVVDQLVVLNKSGLREKVARAQFHASELMKVAFEIRNDMSKGSDARADEHGSQQSYADHTSSSPAPHPHVPSAPTSHPPPTHNPAPTPTPAFPSASLDASYQTLPIIPIPIAIHEFQASTIKPAEEVQHIKIPKKAEDLIGFEQKEKKLASESGKVDPAVNGVKTSSMRERAVPATQLVITKLI
jgi:hypothetical protein